MEPCRADGSGALRAGHELVGERMFSALVLVQPVENIANLTQQDLFVAPRRGTCAFEQSSYRGEDGAMVFDEYFQLVMVA